MSEQEAPKPAEPQAVAPSATPSPAPSPTADAAASAAIKAANDAVAKARTANTAAAAAQADAATATAVAEPPGSAKAGGGAQPFALGDFERGGAALDGGPIDLLSDVTLNVKIELGRTRMLVEDVLRLTDGTVVELDKIAGDPVDVYVNERLVARGEVLVLNDNFCVRISEIVTNQIPDSK